MYTVCTASNPSNIKGFTTITPNAGSTVYNSDSTPYTGSFSYIKIFNYDNINGNDKVFIVTGGTGVLGSEYSCVFIIGGCFIFPLVFILGVLYSFFKHLFFKFDYSIYKQLLPIIRSITLASDGLANAGGGELLNDV